MNNGIKYTLIFAIGAGIGSVVTWAVLKPRYERSTQEQIDEVKEHYKRKYTANSETPTDISIEDTKDNDEEYDQTVTDLGYSESPATEGNETKIMDRPYVIHPNDFGEYDEYDRISLSYYADGILADEDDEIVEDVESIVGFESLNHFGEYEDDSVYVRNDVRKVDYEILLDQRRYSEVMNRAPHRVEG